jgi:hypothetical protein
VALYKDHLAAFQKANARLKPGPVDQVAATILEAVEASRPKRRYVVGDARMTGILTNLPARLRDRLVVTALGLNQVKPV